jgi:hypothetical protein
VLDDGLNAKKLVDWIVVYHMPTAKKQKEGIPKNETF